MVQLGSAERRDARPNNGFAPGHSFGQYLSGLARDYAATGDKATQEKVHRIVRGFGPAISSHFWDDNRFPAYTYDKISIGMSDAHEFAGDAQAFKAMDAALDSVMAHLPPKGLSREQQYARPHKDESFCWDEPYTVPENAFLAWQRGAGSRYKDLGVRFLADDWYWDPLAAGQNVLPGKHAYSHVNAMSVQCRRILCWGMRSICGRRGTDLILCERRVSRPVDGGRMRTSACRGVVRSARA